MSSIIIFQEELEEISIEETGLHQLSSEQVGVTVTFQLVQVSKVGEYETDQVGDTSSNTGVSNVIELLFQARSNTLIELLNCWGAVKEIVSE